MSTITCKKCGDTIEVSAALQGQIEAQVLETVHKQHEAELEKVRTDAAEAAKANREAALEAVKKRLESEKELLRKQAETEVEIIKKRLESEAESLQKKTAAQQEMLIRSLKDDAATEKEQSKQLREQLGELMKSLREERKAKENAQLEAQQRMAEEEGKIREEVAKSADEKYRLKLAEQEKQLADTKKALEDAQRKAAQGSQQNQGEVLELDLENRLREEFPYDEIQEVKKGQRGADIKQIVRNQVGSACGILLWETKNGKWQPAWVAKFKQDIREANANIGVIVSQEIPADIGELKHLEGNVWVVTPKLAARLAAALRITILQVDSANKMNAGKDAKMEALYQFLVGPEFRHRVEAIIENYTILQDEIEKEKRSYALKWARQEKAIRAVIDNTIGMYGDLQGITNRALPNIKSLELDVGEEFTEQEQQGLLV
jgi:hypothetical protein